MVADYDEVFAPLADISNFDMFYTIYHTWTPYEMARVIKAFRNDKADYGVLLKQGDELFDFGRLLHMPRVSCTSRSVSDVLDIIKEKNLGLHPFELVIEGMKFVSYGKTQSRAKLLFDLVALSLSTNNYDILLDDIKTFEPFVSKIFLSPNLDKLLNDSVPGTCLYKAKLIAAAINFYMPNKKLGLLAALVLLVDDLKEEGKMDDESLGYVDSLSDFFSVASCVNVLYTTPSLDQIQDQLLSYEGTDVHIDASIQADDKVKLSIFGGGMENVNYPTLTKLAAESKINDMKMGLHMNRMELAIKAPHWDKEISNLFAKRNRDLSLQLLGIALAGIEEIGPGQARVAYMGKAHTVVQDVVAENTRLQVFSYRLEGPIFDRLRDDSYRPHKCSGIEELSRQVLVDPRRTILVIDGTASDFVLPAGVFGHRQHTICRGALSRLIPLNADRTIRVVSLPAMIWVRFDYYYDNDMIQLMKLFDSLGLYYDIQYFPSSDLFESYVTFVFMIRPETVEGRDFVPRCFKKPSEMILVAERVRLSMQLMLFQLVSEHRVSLASVRVLLSKMPTPEDNSKIDYGDLASTYMVDIPEMYNDNIRAEYRSLTRRYAGLMVSNGRSASKTSVGKNISKLAVNMDRASSAMRNLFELVPHDIESMVDEGVEALG